MAKRRTESAKARCCSSSSKSTGFILPFNYSSAMADPKTEISIMRGRHVLTDPRKKEKGVIRDGAIAIEAGVVAAVGSFDALRKKYPGAKTLGDGKQLLMPGLVDAHSHGRGMSPIQKGVKNDFLENALFDWAYMHLLPPELCAGMTAYHHLR